MVHDDQQASVTREPVNGDNALRVAPIDRNSLNAPNIVTVSRLFLAVVLFALIDQSDRWMMTSILFVVAVSTDALDGYLARKYGQVTTLGRILDPFVDKFIVCGTFVFLVSRPEQTGVTAWMVVVVLGREMFVSGLRGFLEQQGLDFSADWSGKIKMVLQCVGLTASLLSCVPDLQETGISPLRDFLLWLAVLVTAYSGLAYIWRAIKLLNRNALQ